MSPYYTTLSCAWTHYLVLTDPMLCGPLTDSGCTYASYFTSTVTPEVKVEQSSDLRAEQSSEMGAERSSDIGVGWNLEQQKCEMGCPLTSIGSEKMLASPLNVSQRLSNCLPDSNQKTPPMVQCGIRLQSVQLQSRSCDLPHIQPRQ